jgi:hypothetical protein
VLVIFVETSLIYVVAAFNFVDTSETESEVDFNLVDTSVILETASVISARS